MLVKMKRRNIEAAEQLSSPRLRVTQVHWPGAIELTINEKWKVRYT